MAKGSKKQDNKVETVPDFNTGFSKSDWFGLGRKDRKQKKQKKQQPKNDDN